MDFLYFTRDKNVDFAERIVSFILVVTVFFLSGCSHDPIKTSQTYLADPAAINPLHHSGGRVFKHGKRNTV